MANEKLFTNREAAIAVLAKAQELLAKSEFAKSGNSPAPMLALSEKNPDEKQDVKLGEEVEGLCERHMMENKDAERKEGHKIVKSESCTMCKSSMQKSEFSDLYADLEKMQKTEGVDENEIGTKFQKAEDKGQGSGIKESPSNPMKPRIKEEGKERDYSDFETKPGHADAPDHREAPTMKPSANPKEKAEGNNPEAGSVPGAQSATGAISGKGVHKLSHFCGHLSAKKGMKKGIALG